MRRRKLSLAGALVLGAVTLAAWFWYAHDLRVPSSSSSPHAEVTGATGSPAASPAASTAAPLLSREAEEGRLLFERYCVYCHGISGDGFGINAPNLLVEVPNFTDPDFMPRRTESELVDAIARGGRGRFGLPIMPEWRLRLSDREIDALVTYIRTLASRKDTDN